MRNEFSILHAVNKQGAGIAIACIKVQIDSMKKILMAAALIGTVAAITIVYIQYLADEKHIEDPTMDIWL